MRMRPERTILTNESANEVFGRAISFAGDCSLCALYRAIVLDHEGLTDALGTNALMDYDEIDIDQVPSAFETAAKFHVIVTDDVSKIPKSREGWQSFDAPPYCLDRYISQFSPTRIFIKADEKKVRIFTERLTETWIQAIESILFSILPWYYPTKDPETIAFFRNLSIDKSEIGKEELESYIADYVNEVATKHDVSTIWLSKSLGRVVAHAREQLEREARNDISSLQNNIADRMRNLEQLYDRLEKRQLELTALSSVQGVPTDEYIEFFKTHKNVRIDNIEDHRIFYHVVDTLEYYDMDEAKLLFENKRGWLCDDFSETFVSLMKKIFIERRGIIRIEGDFSFSNLRLVSPRQGHIIEKEAMPNPHIYFYGCSGANDKYYSQYASSGDWQLAIEQSISATKNWSVGDGVVGNRMFNWLSNINVNKKFIYVKDGSPMENIEGARLVSLKEFEKIVNEKKEEES